MKKIWIFILMSLLILGCSKKIDKPILIEEPKKEIEKFKEEYENYNSLINMDVSLSYLVHYANVDEVYELLTKQTGIIYFGRPTCPWCRSVVPIILEEATKNGLIVNYLNPGNLTGDDMLVYTKIKEYLSNYLLEDENGEKTLYIPDVYFVKNGNIVGHNLGTVPSHNNPYIPLTEEEKNELVNIYKNYINIIKQ